MNMHFPGEGRGPAPPDELGPGFRRGGNGGAAGTLLGIARHARPRGPMETLERIEVTLAEGVRGDFRGTLKPGRNKRQVTVMAVEAWRDALAELGQQVPWQERRVNLMVEGLALENSKGARIRFACGIELEVTGECDPCFRMEKVALGLEAALLPHWRGGVNTRVIAGGMLSVGDEVRIDL